MDRFIPILLFTSFLFLNTKTADAQWNTVPTGLPYNLQAQFVDEQTVFLVGSSGLPNPETNGLVSKSTNGGKTFSPILEVFDGEYSAIHFINSQTGFIAGDHQGDGVVLKTTNGGNSWQTIQLPALVPAFQDFYFINDQIGFLCGGAIDNLLYKTIDGGNSWNAIIAHPGHGLRDIQFVDDNNGYVASFDGKIYQTFDQGNTWIEMQNLPQDDNIDAIHFINKNVWLIAYDDGDAYRTRNGGRTWSLVYLPDDENPAYSRFHFINDVMGFWMHSNIAHVRTLPFTSTESPNELPTRFEVNPNPASEQINVAIEYATSIPVLINLFDAMGQKCESVYSKFSPVNISFDLARMPVGIYFIQIVSERGIGVKSFIRS